MKCFLCLKNSSITFNIFEGSQEGLIALNIMDIIKRHIYLELNNLGNQSNSNLCDKCWSKIQSFHIFCLNIEAVHRNLSFFVKKELHYGNDEDIDVDTSLIIQNKLHKIEIPENLDYDDIETQDIETNNIETNNIEPETFLETEGYIENEYKYKHEIPNVSDNGESFRIIDTKFETIYQKAQNALNEPEIDLSEKKIAEFMTISCYICNEIFSTFGKLKIHTRKIHNENGSLTCCGKKFKKRSLLLHHIDSHLNPDLLRCDICSKSFSRKDTLAKHIKMMHESNNENKTFPCDGCDKVFAREDLLKTHRSCHIPRELWTFECKECEKKFPTRILLKCHIHGVHKKKEKICDLCGKVLDSKHFPAHMRKHNGIQERVQCHICNSILMKKYFRTHLRNHEDAGKDFPCSHCGKISPNRKALEKHIYIVHREKTKNLHECNFCHKKFGRKDKLDQHLPVHTGEHNYKCKFCEKSFKFFSHVYEHKKRHHPVEFEIERNKKNLSGDLNPTLLFSNLISNSQENTKTDMTTEASVSSC